MTPPRQDGIDYDALRARLALAAEAWGVDASPMLTASDDVLNEDGVPWIIENLPGLSLDWVMLGDARGLLRQVREFLLVARAIQNAAALAKGAA